LTGTKITSFSRQGILYTEAVEANRLQASTKNFKIKHPVLEAKTLYHASVEAPRNDLIYRGASKLSGGRAIVDVCMECNTTGGLARGTLTALSRNHDVHVSNKSGFTPLRGRYEDEFIFVDASDPECQDDFCWLLVCERRDESVKSDNLTDSEGALICEHDAEFGASVPPGVTAL
jgi:hypothetical protein